MSNRIGIGIDVFRGLGKIAKLILAYFARVTAAGGVYEGEVCLKTKLNSLDAIQLLDNASLITIPSGYEEDVVFSQVPTSGAGDLDFTRASIGTRINSSGLIELVPKNLLTFSEQFDNGIWVKSNTTLTANNTVAPNGSATADRLMETGANLDHSIYFTNTQTFTNATQSIYVKPNGRNNISLRFYFGANDWVATVFDLTGNGSVTQTSAGASSLFTGVTRTIVNVGNGWYRISMTVTQPIRASFAFALDLCSSPTPTLSATGGVETYVGDITKGVFIWGAQFEANSTATDYLPTTDRLNMPRLTYPIGGGCPSLLLEPQRTNLVNYSEQFDNAAWTKVASSISQNVIISPDGTQNADKLVPFATPSVLKYINGSASTLISNSYIFSVFAKAAEYDKLRLQYGNTGAGVWFDLTNGTVISNPSGLQTFVENFSNGWWKMSIRFTTIDILAVPVIAVSNTTNFTIGDGTSGAYIWGAQLEQGSYPTSYIPTTTATVTRLADTASKTGISSLIGQTEGTIYLDLVFSQSIDASYVSISDGTVSNRIIIGAEGGVFYTFGVFNYGGLPLSINTRYKIALAYNSTDMVIYINGNYNNIVYGTLSGSFNRFGFDRGDNFQKFLGNINTVNLYKTRLTNSQLASLTTI